ncbi:N-acetyltransferase [Alkalihalobacillus sp. AL-G]|uniref:GNAT family N-acetyltransferase n=1 Tax=Alkalihalobacillus sp. AL-G TaxID=2926399 RepID=UPI00272D1FED|nr:GNAT family N-acetyltransferase [Alkalihalobacillus sp. AL-G]WLD94192.1 GNAT family N-acetyltransferase [Alkalihalobacillus sp. AL-G]
MIQFQEMMRRRSPEEYTDNIIKNYDMTFVQASDLAVNEFNELLSDGLNTVNHYLYNVVDELKNNAGVIWYFYNQVEKEAYIYEIWIDPAYRGKEHASKAIELYHDHVKELGARKVGLHVFGKTGLSSYMRRWGLKKQA